MVHELPERLARCAECAGGGADGSAFEDARRSIRRWNARCCRILAAKEVIKMEVLNQRESWFNPGNTATESSCHDVRAGTEFQHHAHGFCSSRGLVQQRTVGRAGTW